MRQVAQMLPYFHYEYYKLTFTFTVTFYKKNIQIMNMMEDGIRQATADVNQQPW